MKNNVDKIMENYKKELESVTSPVRYYKKELASVTSPVRLFLSYLISKDRISLI